ncbi:MAG: PAS domain S-box protein, partial [Geminicoccaceae bacterium]
MVHRAHRALYVNRAWAELHGLTVDEVMSLDSLLDLIHESELERLQGYASQRLLKGADLPTRYRYRALHKSGRLIWVEQFVRIIDWNG